MEQTKQNQANSSIITLDNHHEKKAYQKPTIQKIDDGLTDVQGGASGVPESSNGLLS
tara:strand:- start:9 stop:179 length:171 start_codon:yes stop_codon:yes gene_type:complete